MRNSSPWLSAFEETDSTDSMTELRCSLKPAAALQANAVSKLRLTLVRDNDFYK